MYCIRCGSKLKDGSKYCLYCGAPTQAVRKEKPQKSEAFVPPEHIDEFTIGIPNDFIRTNHAAQAESAGSDADTQAISAKEVRKLMREQEQEKQAALAPEQPDAPGDAAYTQIITPSGAPEQADPAGSDAYTQAISTKEVRKLIREKEQQAALAPEQPDAPGDAAYTQIITPLGAPEQADPAGSDADTQAISAKEVRKLIREKEQQASLAPEQPDAPGAEIPLQDIPDIPIPADYITASASEQNQSVSEQLMSRRSILFVVVVVVLLFAIAAGACVLALRGGAAPSNAGSGSASTEVGFWSGEGTK